MYEYKTLIFKSADNVDEKLNDFAKQGWRAISTSISSHDLGGFWFVFLLERKI